jgi:hypothetical protein
MLRIRITFDADPDSDYLFRADPVTDLLLRESGFGLSPLVRLRLLILYDANPDSTYPLWCGSGY